MWKSNIRLEKRNGVIWGYQAEYLTRRGIVISIKLFASKYENSGGIKVNNSVTEKYRYFLLHQILYTYLNESIP